ncbi:hypothetical protein HF086_007503 [Spodoptera exigua]|uniref:PiggyBac transposable element-derived protein domain-containing protein n=1 Tax=Spodoptera exigua TaxID=7107 RepID=A0A922M306_SPOEX|nr:hypothetical protein HF086_007503 [Spodoptera exigua]
MAGRKDSLRGLSSFKSRGHRLVGLVPPENAPSDIDSRSEPENEEEIAVYRTEELSSSPCPSIDSDIERMHILDSSHTSEDHISVNGSENNPVSEFEDQVQPPLTPIINNVLPPTGEGLLSDKELKKRGRGSFSQVVDNDKKIAIVKWYNNKVVTLACSYADAYPVHEIKRWRKEQKQKIGVTCPQLVRHYNQHMGGVDLCDMLIALYRTSFKSRRWYMNIFGQMLDIAVNNAWLLYRRNCNMKA